MAKQKTKSRLMSKTYWGLGIAALGMLMQLYGWSEAGLSISLAGLGLAGYGRDKAKLMMKPLKIPMLKK